jgi:CheY-like chemotaxis protein
MIKVHTALQGSFMRLMVTDTGVGIAPEDIDSIFDEFHQVKSNSATEGLGLGLSIVQRTAELLNCKVGVQSELGHGSSFYIDVPLGSMENSTEHEDTATSSRPEGSGHVLIVDDEPDIIEATTMLLEIEGFSVSSAQSVPSLRGFIMGAPQPPDLLISDFHLRDGETGLEIIELAREAFGQQLPVILISGDTQNQALLKNQENVLFFTKPVDVEQLIDNAVRLISEK